MRTDRRGSLGLLAAGAAFPLVRPPRSRELRFGLTPVVLDDDRVLMEGLERWLRRATGFDVLLVRRRTYQEITTLLLAGQLDAAWICGYPFVQFRDRLELVAVPLWRGRPLYRSYVIVPAESTAERLSDLRGTIHAFSDPDSNSGWLATTAELVRRGEEPGRFFRHVFFTYAHRKVARAVAARLADGGSIDGYVFEVLGEVEPELTARCRVLRRSPLFGFPPVACRRLDAGSEPVLRLREALLAMADHPDGRAVLDHLRLDGFTAGTADLFGSIAANARLVVRTLG